MKYKAICFDIDGTLYDVKVQNSYVSKMALRHPVVCARYNALRKHIRAKQDDFENTPLKNKSFREREAIMFMESSGLFKSEEKARRYLDDRYYNVLYKYYGVVEKQPEVIRTMHYLKYKGIRTAVLSDWPIQNKLNQIGVDEFMEFKICSDDSGYLKPSVHCFEYLLYNLKLEASEILYVGDSYEKDILGAGKAGIDAVLMNCNEQDAEKKYPEALKICTNWAEFDVWLKKTEK